MNLDDDWNDLRPPETRPLPKEEMPLRCRWGFHKWKWSKSGNSTAISDCVLCKEHREEYVA